MLLAAPSPSGPSPLAAPVEPPCWILTLRQHMKEVLKHPSFMADPFAALQEHLANTVNKPDPPRDDEMRGREWGDYSEVSRGGKKGRPKGGIRSR